MKVQGISHIGVHGCSLGAATIIYALSDFNDYSFVVLESSYDRLDHAFYNRMQNIPLPNFAYKPGKFFVSQQIGRNVDELNPEEYVALLRAPVLYFAGDSEFQIKVEETNSIFENISSSNKKLHWFRGGKHEDFMVRFQDDFSNVLTQFLNNI